MKIQLIHGPNLNWLGKREKELYGNFSSEELVDELQKQFPQLEISYFQSNREGDLVDAIQSAAADSQGILINAGAFAHTSIAMADAVKAMPIPVMNIHISNTNQREEYRKTDMLADASAGSIVGLGKHGYTLAMECLLDLLEGQ